MKYTICFICLIASLLFSACGTDYKKIDAVTGLHLYDANGSAVGLWNSPNDNMDPSTLIFPNPNNPLF